MFLDTHPDTTLTVKLMHSGTTYSGMVVPRKVFFTRGTGVHKDRLASFELALRDAGIERFNLVYVSSIFPPNCIEVSREEGLQELATGEIVYVVLARNDTNEPDRRLTSAIGLALPKESNQYGYLSEHHAFGETQEDSGEYAEDLAATMLATTLGISFNPDTAWQEREQIYKASGKIITTSHVCEAALGNGNGLWTTVIAAAVFVLGPHS